MAVAAACVLAALARAAPAVDEIPLRNVEGALLVKSHLRTDQAKIPAFVVLDLGTRAPLLIHERTAALLGIERQGHVELMVDSANVVLGDLDAVAKPLEPLETLTRDHAQALDDIPAVAVLGTPAFSGRTIELDIPGNALRLLLSGASSGGSDGSSAPSDVATFTYTEEAYGYWLEAEAPGGQRLRVRLATSEYDTRIDLKVAERLGAPGGDLPHLMLGSMDIARYAVLRPSDHSQFPEPRPDVILGTGLLSHFLVTLEADQRRLELQPIREPKLALEERAFFVARARSDAQGIESFLEAHPDSRLASEASEALLSLRLSAGTKDLENIKRAMTWHARSAKPERRARRMVQLADELIAMENERADAHDLALLALEVGQPYAAEDLDDTAIHHINARRGLVALLREDYTRARRYLLSAAFGVPKDPYVNLWLGRLYEKTGQRPRAWSRYIEAALRDEPPTGALRGLDRLNRDPDFRKQFSMVDAARLLEGRLPVFMPVRRYEPAGPDEGRPVHLVELFTDINEPITQAPQMAVEGLTEYFSLADTVFVQYHVGDVLATEASEARAAYYDVKRAPVALFDGGAGVAQGGEDKAAAKVFALYRERCLQNGKAIAGPRLRGHTVWEGDHAGVRVWLDAVEGEAELVLHVLLCERAVMAIGANGQVLHRHVVRAALSPLKGWRVAGAGPGGAFKAEVDQGSIREELERRLDKLEQTQDGRLPMRPTWIDASECEVVSFLQEPTTRRVVAALTLPRSLRKDEN